MPGRLRTLGELEYQVVSKSSIPPTPKHSKRYHGEWTALMELMRKLQPHECIKLTISDGMSERAITTSIHSAAHRRGLKVSTHISTPYVFVVRTERGEYKSSLREVECANCKFTFKTYNKKSLYCASIECQNARREIANIRRRRQGIPMGEVTLELLGDGPLSLAGIQAQLRMMNRQATIHFLLQTLNKHRKDGKVIYDDLKDQWRLSADLASAKP